MKTDENLLRALFEAIPASAKSAPSVKIQHPVKGMESIHELRRAIQLAEERGYLDAPEEVMAGGFWVSLTDTGRELV